MRPSRALAGALAVAALGVEWPKPEPFQSLGDPWKKRDRGGDFKQQQIAKRKRVEKRRAKSRAARKSRKTNRKG